MQACIANGIVGDFRAPDIMRFGFTPLYISPEDVTIAAARIERVIRRAAVGSARITASERR